MNKTVLIFLCMLCTVTGLVAQTTHKGALVYKGQDVVFHKIDDHTWVGNGNKLYNESVYIVEGTQRAILIDAGTDIKDLDKIVASITSKPVTLYATHVHPDHTGSAVSYFDKIYLNIADSVNYQQNLKEYRGQIIPVKDGDVIDLGGRRLQIVFTPGHTPGSITFVDAKAGYGFSGDAFGSTNLLLMTKFSTFIATCKKMQTIMKQQNIKVLYPGHYSGGNPETLKRVQDMQIVSEEVLYGKIRGEAGNNRGLPLIVKGDGFQINYNQNGVN